MKKFTISNMSPTAFNWISYLCGVVFGVLGIFLFFAGMTRNLSFQNVLGMIFIVLAVTLPFAFMGMARTSVEYDEINIKTSSIFKKREIIIQDIQGISYEFETCYRSFNNAVHLDIELKDSSTVSLTDTVSKEDTDRLVKGDHSFVPLLVMYDEIAGKYPDKVKEESGDK